MIHPWSSSSTIVQTYGNGALISSKSFLVSPFVSFCEIPDPRAPPDDFFVGIGDINSTFLPKVEPLLTPTLTPKPLPSKPSLAETTSQPGPSLPSQTSPEQTERAESVKDAMLTQNSLALEAQLEERPLAKKQEELLSTEDKDNKPPDPSPPPDVATESSSETLKPEKVPRKALLKNDDAELQRITKVCLYPPSSSLSC